MSPVSLLNHISRTLETEFNAQIYMRMSKLNLSSNSSNAHVSQSEMVYSGVLMPDKRACYGKEYVHILIRGRGYANIAQWNPSSYKAFCSNYGDYATPKMGSHCWNEEAIQGMTTDLSAVWDSFVIDLKTEIERVNTTAVQIYAKVLEIATSPAANASRAISDTGSAVRTLASNLLHREHLTRYGIEQVTEAFQSKLYSLRTDTLSSVRTSSIGELMESTYHAANMEYGKSTLHST
jgi:hypothetical protein